MSLETFFIHDVTVLAAGTRTDDYGDTQPDWTSPTTSATRGWLHQQSSTENLDGRNGTSSVFVLFLPTDTAITARSRVMIDGRTYELDAEPLLAQRPSGPHHIECRLKVVDG